MATLLRNQPSQSVMTSGDQQDQTDKVSRLNIPNALSVIRIFGSAFLVGIALLGLPIWFVVLYVILGITDLVDGPLARRLKQESMAGAKLDSIADILLTAALLAGVCLLKWELIVGELYWLILPATSYTVALAISFSKFQRMPALHSLAAKVNHFLVAVAGLCLLLNLSVLPLRIVCITTLLTNTEVIAILVRMRHWQTDVISLFHLKQ